MSDHYHIDPWASHTHSFSLPIYTDSNVPPGTLIGVGGSTYMSQTTFDAMRSYPQMWQGPKQKEPEVSTLEKIRRERQEAREREKIEQMYTDYDEFDVDGLGDGIVLRFSWTPKDSEKSYEYAALKAAGRWYVTGRESPNGLAGEDFVAWLIGKDVAVADLIELVAA